MVFGFLLIKQTLYEKQIIFVDIIDIGDLQRSGLFFKENRNGRR